MSLLVVTQNGEVKIESVELITKVCGTCGVVFALPKSLDDENQKQGASRTWYCPNGHARVYRETDSDRLQKQLARERHQREQAEADRTYWRKQSEANARRVSAAKGRITRLRKRCVAGLCTCCNQEFPDLAAHMQAAHPDAETRED